MTADTGKLEITHEMSVALQVMGRRNVFITGRAGTGKSTLLRYFCDGRPGVVKLAPTGVAALNIGGQTIHSFFWPGQRLYPGVALKDRPKNPALYEAIQVLVIDECSMLRADLFDHVNAFLMVYGPHPGEPFGGIPVVLFGDPYQLPPVAPLDDGPLLKDYQSVEKFFFDARAYQGFTEIELTKVFRQAEGDYLNVLNGIRDGTISDQELALLAQRVVPDVSPRYLKDT